MRTREFQDKTLESEGWKFALCCALGAAIGLFLGGIISYVLFADRIREALKP